MLKKVKTYGKCFGPQGENVGKTQGNVGDVLGPRVKMLKNVRTSGNFFGGQGENVGKRNDIWEMFWGSG